MGSIINKFINNLMLLKSRYINLKIIYKKMTLEKKYMDKILKILAPFGIMGIVFIIILTSAMATGLAGAAAFTATMAAFGPGGMIGGLVTLGLVGLVSSVALQYGYDPIVIAVIKEQMKTLSKDEMWEKIDTMKFLSKDLKMKIKNYIVQA